MSTNTPTRAESAEDEEGTARPGSERDDLQQRLEGSETGRAVISAFVALTLIALIVINMPGSQTRSKLMPAAEPYVNALGLDQNWGVFAPNPRDLSGYLVARVDHRDGTTAERLLPFHHGLAEYWDYRWQRWGEQLLLQPSAKAQWEPYARWLAGQYRAEGGDPVRVTLFSRYARTLPPGPGPDRQPFADNPFFTLPLEGS